MNFLNPLAFVWALLIPLIVLLYFLKLKRKELPISSTYLWKKSVMDLRVNAPFQRLRKNFLLFLQILILLAAILALAHPFLDVRGFERQSLIVLVDRSASMSARSEAGTRLDLAKAAANDLVDDLSAGDEMSVIAFSSAARVISPFTRSKAALRQAISRITPGGGGTEISAALEVASSLARLRQNPEVILLSDGRFGRGAETALERAKLHYVRVGDTAPNLGVTALDLRRGTEVGGEMEAFVRVENFSPVERTATITLRLDGADFDAREVKIPAGGAISRLFSGLGVRRERVLEASVEAEGRDALAADDRAYAVMEKPVPIRVVLATGWGYFFDRDLALDPEVAFPHAKISHAEIDPAGEFVYSDGLPPDVVILDGAVPERLAPGSYLVVGPPPPVEGFAREGEVDDPVLLDWNGAHPVMRFVNLQNLRTAKAGRISLPREANVLAESDEGPLIVSYEGEGIRLVHLNFGLRDTNWPLDLSFPIFVSNSLRWLAGRDRSDLGRQVRTGGVIPIEPVEGGEVEVRLPSGRKVDVRASAEVRTFFGGTEEVGLYTVAYPDGREEVFAVNLLDGAESDLEPAEDVPLGEGRLEATAGAIRTNREIWWPLTLAAFVILLLEWYVYNRRVQI